MKLQESTDSCLQALQLSLRNFTSYRDIIGKSAAGVLGETFPITAKAKYLRQLACCKFLARKIELLSQFLNLFLYKVLQIPAQPIRYNNRKESISL